MLITGMGSGMDYESMISAIVGAERAPEDNQLNREEAQSQAELGALQKIQSTINSFRDTVESLDSTREISKLKSSVSDDTVLGASVDGSAVSGEYNFNVTQLATAQRDQLVSLSKDGTLKSGTVGFTAGGKTVSVDTAKLATKLANDATQDKADHHTNTLKRIAEQYKLDTKETGWETKAEDILTNKDNANFDADRLKSYLDTQKRYDDTLDRLKNQGVTLEEVQNAINGDANNDGLKATLVRSGDNVSLVLNAKGTGTASAFTVDDTSSPLVAGKGTISGNHLQIQAAQDAKVDFGSMQLTSSSNRMENVIDGMTLTLKKTGKVNVNVEQDRSAVSETVKKFVDSYNAVMETVNTYSKSSEQSAAVLAGDAGVRSLVSRMREALGKEYDASTFKTLSQLGVTTTQQGTLELDQGKLDKALDDDFDAVSKLFAGDPLDDTKPGLMSGMMTVLDSYHKNGGLFDQRMDRIKYEDQQIVKDREDLDQRMLERTNSLRDYYAKMDTKIGSMNQTKSMLVGLLR